MGEIRKKHGLTGTRFYNIYMHMKMLCYNKKCKSYPNYGGRGISVCDEWKNDSSNFVKDMYENYLKHVEKYGEENTTLERVDVNGDYTPENCIWATRKIQNNNNRKVKKYEYKGEVLTITQICELEGRKDAQFIYRRVWEGWDLYKALNTPKLEPKETWKERKTHGRPKKMKE
ncbi:hypothetical protein [Bacillus sp. FSL L8-0152]|uniref:hypothetical protein n=1 Tax=Bacillus sp. FSL L8-0152 TaxID=2921516 RepID=UPI0030F8E271